MDLAEISLAALALVVVASCFTRLHPGILAIVLAWVLAIYIAPCYGRDFEVGHVVAGFPTGLFLDLTGVTLLFTQAQVNGTLDRVTRIAVGLCRGNVGLIPIMFCLLSAVLATIGAGNIASAALIAPMAMATAQRARIPPFLMAIMVCHGAIAGALSPISPTGIIAANQMRDKLGLVDFELEIYLHNLGFNLVIGFASYFLFGGWRLFGRRYEETAPATTTPQQPTRLLEPAHLLTLAVIGLFIAAVVILDTNLGMTAFAGAVTLTVLRLSDEDQALRKLPWSVILMVCGVSTLIAIIDKTGGVKLLAQNIGDISTSTTVTGVAAFVSAIVSVYSSTSGVVLPAFLPIVPDLVTAVGGDPLKIASAIIVGGHLVDASPLSTIGALCIAGAPPEDRHTVYRGLLIWGLAMSVVGAVGCLLVF